jgi:hypothetical protein
MDFLNAEVNAQFECLVDTDRLVHKLGLYSGPLSKITLPMAEHMASKPSVLIKRKDGVAKTESTSSPKPSTKKNQGEKEPEKTEE